MPTERSEVGGERGIRTPGTVSGSVVFKTTAIDHSAISPRWQFSHNGSPDEQPRLASPRAVARDRQVGALGVLQAQVEAAARQRRELLDARRVDDRAAVN